MKFEPTEIPRGSQPFFKDVAGAGHWAPLYSHPCTFGPPIFTERMMNLIKNPNLNSSWLFRADILHDSQENKETASDVDSKSSPIISEIVGMARQRTLVRRLIPRNERRDKPMEQTCLFYGSEASPTSHVTLVIYTPHTSSADDIPFYHPKVQSIAHLHEWNPSTESGSISIHFLPYPQHPLSEKKLQRTAYHLLEIIHKHGHGAVDGYVKRVHHDVVIPQQRFQGRYAQLKNKYAAQLVETWAEKTDPTKHVFEDLGIAAFLIELWHDMYPKKETEFPGFVDIGCGNGLLVFILNQEGYQGWGFDARERKSWAQYKTLDDTTCSGMSLEERLLLPSFIPSSATTSDLQKQINPDDIHDGKFPPGVFIVSNHADELTPWTPILAALSQCPFIMIPCCSHKLTGEKFRAPPPRDKSKPKSTYASLVDWVSQIAEDCGWEAETEMLRIPSTRNTCLIGRRRNKELLNDVDITPLLEKYGGVQAYYENVAKLVKSGPRGH